MFILKKDFVDSLSTKTFIKLYKVLSTTELYTI